MASLSRPRLFVRLVPVVALLLALVVAVGPVAAAAPTVTANPAKVPFSETPGQPGTTTVTFAANGTTGLTACGQDNQKLPTFPLGAVDPNTPLVVNFPYIQAGKYTFWVSTDPTCAAGTKLTIGGAPVQATAIRLGPNGFPVVQEVGKDGSDDVQIRYKGTNTAYTNKAGFVYYVDLALVPSQQFPIPGLQVCMMVGDGTQQDLTIAVGQDQRDGAGSPNLGRPATLVRPYAGQNGCYDLPWVVNGGYDAFIQRPSNVRGFYAQSLFGFCVPKGVNQPSNPPADPTGVQADGQCGQVAFSRDPNDSPFPNGTVLNGAIVTGADNHAVQVCVAAFTPDGGRGGPVATLANTANAYNQSGAVNLTPLTLEFPPKTAVKVQTFDITGPGPGGQGGAQFACPTATAIQSGSAITAIITTDPAGTTAIDTKFYFIL